MYGYMGEILHVDLTSGEITKEKLDEQIAKNFLGGNGLAAKLIYDNVPKDVGALDEKNAVVFATGPLNETPMWGAGRGHMASISPLTNIFADSNFGGDFSSMLKRTGFDAVVVTGKAVKPVYLFIDEDHIEIRSAEKIWGKDTEATHKALLEAEGGKLESASIGPAGENGVLFANVICSGKRVSAAGRGGLGAVLGHKNFKALAVRGTKKPQIADEATLKSILKQRLPILKEGAALLTKLGTPSLVNIVNDKGLFPTRNNSKETFSEAAKISGEVIEKEYKQKNISCTKCPVACGKTVKIPSGEFKGQDVKMVEYETLYSIGSMLENSDIVSIFNGNTMCDHMGVDTISMGVTLAFLAECVEKGLVTEQKLGAKVAFADGENLTELIRKAATREGVVGELLSLGSERIAACLGDDANKYLYSVKGLEIAGHSARGINTMGLAYATSTRGGSHHDARPNYANPDLDKKLAAEYCVRSQNYTAVGDSLVLCRFIMERGFGLEIDRPLVDVINAITGWDLTLEKLNRIGERIYTLERLINSDRGVTRKLDSLPERVTKEPIADGPTKGKVCTEEELQSMLDDYYRLRGWSNDGVPMKNILTELGL